MVRKDRKDITVGKLEEKHGLPPGTVRNETGRKARKDKTLATIKKERSK
jgi:hypothetical protein